MIVIDGGDLIARDGVAAVGRVFVLIGLVIHRGVLGVQPCLGQQNTVACIGIGRCQGAGAALVIARRHADPAQDEAVGLFRAVAVIAELGIERLRFVKAAVLKKLASFLIQRFERLLGGVFIITEGDKRIVRFVKAAVFKELAGLGVGGVLLPLACGLLGLFGAVLIIAELCESDVGFVVAPGVEQSEGFVIGAGVS